ncbi:MAG: efflux RND transporter periplasmic adaptor subunit, partial [Gammaproteobacteria bacterium]|nr:efflux RND transporter periplasmic adaptor subunit [Gammaproteobacteria bacterium]
MDDSRTSAYVTKKILTEFGYQVDHYNSAEPAIVALLESDYDLLLTDLLLSTGGMNGDDLVRFLRMSGHPKKKLLPVIVITGSSDKDTLLRIYEAGANGVLVKPITGDELNERIRGLIPDHAPAAAQSGYALEIHDQPGAPPGSSAPAARKPPPLVSPAATTTDKAPGARKAVPPVAAPGSPSPGLKRPIPVDVKNSQARSAPVVPAVEPPSPVKSRPVTAFGAKKRIPPTVADSPPRDAASVIAELRASDHQDEDIPTLTMALDAHIAETPISKPAAKAERPPVVLPEKKTVARAPKVTASQKPAVNTVSAIFDATEAHAVMTKRPRERVHAPEPPPERPIFDASDAHAVMAEERPPRDRKSAPAPVTAPAAEPPRERSGAREPERELPTDSKAIVTALDISQDFLPMQDETFQPSLGRTITETIKRYKVLSISALASLLIISWSVLNYMSSGGVINVESARAEIGSLHQSVAVPGKVVSKLKVDVSPSAGGQIKQLFVKEGDKVRKGQNIAQLENDEVSNEVKRAEGNLLTTREETAMAEKTVTRMRRALDLGAVSRQAVDEAETALKSVKSKEAAAKEQVHSTRQLLDKLMVTAPFEGTITSRPVQVGQYVRPSDPIVSVVDLSQREIETKVDAADSSSINTGQEVDVSSDAFPGRKWRELVTRVAPSANRETTANTVNVYISLGKEAPPLKVGQQV